MWTINNIRIFVSEINGQAKNIFARLQPLSGGTVIHRFGNDSLIVKVAGLIVGEVDRAALEALANSGSEFILAFDTVTYLEGYVNDISWSRTNYISQTIRPDLDCEAPVFEAELTMYIT